jgi:Protein of unknown function (DUF3565)
MLQPITGFHEDKNHHWVADLACGHGQHVRHRPPWELRPWVVSESGRYSMLGKVLTCKLCDKPDKVEMELPELDALDTPAIVSD